MTKLITFVTGAVAGVYLTSAGYVSFDNVTDVVAVGIDYTVVAFNYVVNLVTANVS